MYTYVYLIEATFFLACWLILFVLVPRTRSALFWTGLILMFGSVGEYWARMDYWHPKYLIDIQVWNLHFGFEDFIFMFASTGVSAGVFQLLIRHKRETGAGFQRIPSRVFLWMAFWGLMAFILMTVLSFALNVNSIYRMMINGLAMMLVIVFVYKRPRLLPLIFLAAFIMAALSLLFYRGVLIPTFPGVMAATWNLNSLSGVMVLGVPLEELAATFCISLFTGPLYYLCIDRHQLRDTQYY